MVNGCNNKSVIYVSGNLSSLVAALILLSWSSVAAAATQTVIETKTTKLTKTASPDSERSKIERVTLDGANGRIEVVEKDGIPDPEVAYMLTTDAGKTWLIADKKRTVCSNWNTKDFFGRTGALLNKYSRIINAKVVSSRVKVIENRPGPKILGRNTQYVHIDSHLRMRASFLFFRADYIMQLVDEIWYSPDLAIDPIEKKWIEASANTGYPVVDNISEAWEQNVKGGIIRQARLTRVTDLRKNQVTTQKVETVEIKSIKNVKTSDLPADIFIKPKCSTVVKREMDEEAKQMLLELAR